MLFAQRPSRSGTSWKGSSPTLSSRSRNRSGGAKLAEPGAGPHLIAEAGTNHNGHLEAAYALVDLARSCGADSVKFQLIHPESLYVEVLWDGGVSTPNPVIEQRRRGSLSDPEFREVSAYAKGVGIPFSASVFDVEGVRLLDELDAPYIKLASVDLNNPRLIEAASKTGRRVILSTGFSELTEIARAVDVATSHGDDLVLMHCVSVYPADTEIMNLRFIETLQKEFGLPVGLSDHTEEDIAAVAAVALGVTFLEKHITTDRGSEGFDHSYAMEPDGFDRYVKAVRAASEALTAQESKLSEAELEVRKRARRGIYAARDISQGEVIAEEDLIVVRPPAPFGADQLDDVVGRQAARSIAHFEPISPGSLD